MHAQLESTRPVMDLDVERQLRHRMAMASPTDTVRGMFFNGALEVARALGGSEAADRCQDVIGREALHRLLQLPRLRSAAHVPGGDPTVGFRSGGRRRSAAAHGHAGGAWTSWPRPREDDDDAGGQQPPAAAQPAAHQLPHRVSFGERRDGLVHAGSLRHFIVKRDFMPPAYTKGFLQGLLEAVGAKNVHVSGRPTGMLDSEYEISLGVIGRDGPVVSRQDAGLIHAGRGPPRETPGEEG